jgi:hypothetical protein
MLSRKLERGDAAGDYGTMWYSALMFGMLIFGLTVAVLGFWRSASAAGAERTAYTRGTREYVYADEGGDPLTSFFVSVTGQTGMQATVSDDNSTVTVGYRRTSTFWSPLTGTWEADQDATMEKYVERWRRRR